MIGLEGEPRGMCGHGVFSCTCHAERDFAYYEKRVMAHLAMIDETELKRMLGCWVSECAPEVAVNAITGEMIGLTCAEIPLGVRAPIAVRVSDEYLARRRALYDPAAITGRFTNC